MVLFLFNPHKYEPLSTFLLATTTNFLYIVYNSDKFQKLFTYIGVIHMTVTAKPIVLSDDGTKHVALPNGSYIDNASIDKDSLISKDTDNLLKTGSDGKLLVAKTEINANIESAKTELSKNIADNTLAINKLQNQVDSVVIVSADASNLLVRGSDNGAKVTSSDLLSNGSAENLIKVNAVDQRLEVAKSDVQDVAKAVIADSSIVSADAGNIIIKGSDKGAYLSLAALPTQVSAGSGIAVDGGRVSVNVGKGLGVNSANQLYVDTNELTAVSLETTEKILNLTTDHVLSATVSAQYNTATGYLTLYGKNSQVLSSVYIPGASSMLQSVEPVTNPTGQPAGKYFRYTFKTTEGSSVIYVPIPAATNLTAGNGIAVSTAGDITTVAVKAKAGSGLTVDAAGVSADTTVLATKEEVKTLQKQVEVIDTENMDFIISSTTVDPATLDKGEAALYPSEDLLG